MLMLNFIAGVAIFIIVGTNVVDSDNADDDVLVSSQSCSSESNVRTVDDYRYVVKANNGNGFVSTEGFNVPFTYSDTKKLFGGLG